MRVKAVFCPILVCLVVLGLPGAARAQLFEVYGSAGPTLTDSGFSASAGIGIQPSSRVAIRVGIDRTHLSTRITRDPFGGQTGFRGGTLLIGTVEARVTPFGHGRAGPYGLVGLGAGVSRPNVNDAFPEPVTNSAQVLFAGGGWQVPLGGRGVVFADYRMIVGAEGNEGIVAVGPVRAGAGWRF